MKSIPDFIVYLSGHCLKKGLKIKSTFNTNNVRSFHLYNKDRKVKFTHSFDNTILEECQFTIFETDNLFITPLDLTKHLITKVDDNFLSKEGLKIKKIFLSKNPF